MITSKTRRSINTHAGNDKGVYEVARPAKTPLNKAMGLMTDDEVRKNSQVIDVRSKKIKPRKQTSGGGATSRNKGYSA